MKIRRLILQIAILTLAHTSWATGMCPFKATDANVVSLSQETASALQSLLDKKNECNEAVQTAVNSAKGLPELTKQLQDPAASLISEEEWVNEEISRVLTNPEMGAKLDPISGMSYMDTLLDRKNKLPGEISKVRIAKKYNDKSDAKVQALSLTQNLISNLSAAMANRDSKCAQAINGGLGTRVLTMGLGLVSVSSPLFMMGKATSASLSASLLSDFVNMFSKMPPNSLQTFDKANQTVDLACLYYQVSMSHCSMAEQVEGASLRAEAKKNLSRSAQCLPGHGLYGQILNLRDLSTELQDMTSAIARNAPLNTADGGSSAFSREVSDLFFKSSTSTTDSDTIKSLINQFEFLKKYFGPTATNSPENLSTSELSTLNNGLSNFTFKIGGMVENAGLTFKSSDGMNNLPAQEKFKINFANIQKFLDKRKVELNLGNDNSILSITDAKRLHEMVNKTEFRRKIQYAKNAYSALKKYGEDNRQLSPESSVDLTQLATQSNRSMEVLDLLDQWTRLEPKSSSPEDMAAYQTELGRLSRDVKSRLNLKNDSTAEVNEKLNYLFGDPLRKAESIFMQRENTTDNSPFAKPFDQAGAKLTDYEKFKSLMNTYRSISDGSIQPADQSLMAETRRLFEASDSNLRKGFAAGLENMIDGINSSPDPKATRYLASQMCALAYSLPNSDTSHAISSCKSILPGNMAPYLYKEQRTKPDCASYRYFKDTLRDEYFSTGKSRSLPLDTGN